MTLEIAIKNNPYNETIGSLTAYIRYLRYNVDGFYSLDSKEVRKKYLEYINNH